MALLLYMDEHVPRAITNALRDRGIDVLTTQEDGRDAIRRDQRLKIMCDFLALIVVSATEQQDLSSRDAHNVLNPFAAFLFSYPRPPACLSVAFPP
ncbi:MAG: DUF5615 family PIN-like protein [bacterium]|nr:DUF5615 family PIN-like protein [bacterium]